MSGYLVSEITVLVMLGVLLSFGKTFGLALGDFLLFLKMTTIQFFSVICVYTVHAFLFASKNSITKNAGHVPCASSQQGKKS
jgi:hypothetical protein